MESDEFKDLLRVVVENRVLIESLYKSLGVSDEALKDHIKKIEPIVNDVLNKYYNNE